MECRDVLFQSTQFVGYGDDDDRSNENYDSYERNRKKKPTIGGRDPRPFGQDFADDKKIYDDKDSMLVAIDVWIRSAKNWEQKKKDRYRGRDRDDYQAEKYRKNKNYKDKDEKYDDDKDDDDKYKKNKNYKDKDEDEKYKKDKNYKDKDEDEKYKKKKNYKDDDEDDKYKKNKNYKDKDEDEEYKKKKNYKDDDDKYKEDKDKDYNSDDDDKDDYKRKDYGKKDTYRKKRSYKRVRFPVRHYKDVRRFPLRKCHSFFFPIGEILLLLCLKDDFHHFSQHSLGYLFSTIELLIKHLSFHPLAVVSIPVGSVELTFLLFLSLCFTTTDQFLRPTLCCGPTDQMGIRFAGELWTSTTTELRCRSSYSTRNRRFDDRLSQRYLHLHCSPF